ncbi:fungal-specific transcription factor domain-containing protein [Kalaharituber pfeilii]|nr:fungal-specific transcription factor domain-containing protein [Kalaharituber pfeilii]
MPKIMTVQGPQTQSTRKTPLVQERKYKCAFCARAFSRSEHRSRHERSHTKERPFKCLKCRSTFVRRDLLLRHDRTVHAKDGGIPLHSEVKRRSTKASAAAAAAKPSIAIETATIEQIEGTDALADMDARAALLITELHQAAVGAILDQEQEALLEEKSRRSVSSSSDAYDSPAPYSSSAAPWDPPTPSSPQGSCNESWNGSLQPPRLQLPSMDRSFSSDPSHAPSLRSGLLSSAATPATYSPYPYTNPPSPLNFGNHCSSTQAVAPPPPPQVESEEERQIILENIREMDVERAVVDKFRLPSRSALNRYLSTYFNLFHHHLPFLHTPSFSPSAAAPPLLLAVLSIGALYTFEKEQAYTLHLSSKVLVNNYLHRHQNFSSRNCPLWNTQTSLLNMVFASWSGDAKGLEWACSIKSLLANLVAGGKYELQLRLEQRGDALPTREEWIEDEGSKRTFFAVYVFFGLLTLTYNHTPAISYNEFDTLSLPCCETLWNLDGSDELAWREQLSMAATPSFKEAHTRLFQGDPPRYSAFAARILINALFLEVWGVKRSPEILESVVTEYRERLRVALDTWHRSLDMCTSETMIVSLTAPQKGHPLVFNAMAMYRCTISRLEVDLMSIQEALRYHVPSEVASAMTAAAAMIPRSNAMTKVIQQCFECFQIPALMGIRWVARTSALNWSVEHPLCGFDLMLILSLWLYRVEEESETSPPNEEEEAMLIKLRNIFDDDSVELYGSRLSAAVARIWGGMIDEVVVWGITQLLGESFKLFSHSLAVEDDIGMSHSTATTPASTPEADEEMSDNE